MIIEDRQVVDLRVVPPETGFAHLRPTQRCRIFGRKNDSPVVYGSRHIEFAVPLRNCPDVCGIPDGATDIHPCPGVAARGPQNGVVRHRRHPRPDPARVKIAFEFGQRPVPIGNRRISKSACWIRRRQRYFLRHPTGKPSPIYSACCIAISPPGRHPPTQGKPRGRRRRIRQQIGRQHGRVDGRARHVRQGLHHAVEMVPVGSHIQIALERQHAP